MALSSSPELDGMLQQIFKNPKSTIIGFGFSADIAQFSKKLPNMKFLKHIESFIDAQDLFYLNYGGDRQTGLAKVAEKLLGKKICKFERMSNWEKRPLR